MGKTSYTHYSIASHLVWIPKYRRRILTGEVEKETKRLIQEWGDRQGLTLMALSIEEDHMHVLVSASPRFSPALIANLLKGYSSRYLREQFPPLKKMCGKERLWTSSYYVGTAAMFRRRASNAPLRRVKESNGKLVGGPTTHQPGRNGAFIPSPKGRRDFPRRRINYVTY